MSFVIGGLLAARRAHYPSNLRATSLRYHVKTSGRAAVACAFSKPYPLENYVIPGLSDMVASEGSACGRDRPAANPVAARAVVGNREPRRRGTPLLGQGAA
jgi:hypothetical protein